MAENPPDHKEITDFKFKLFTRLKVFSENEQFKLDRPSKLVAVASKYGIIFVGTPRGIQCIRAEDLSPQDERASNRNVTAYKRREFHLNSQPTHIDVSCDSEHLAITLFLQDCAVLQVYSIQSCSSTEVRKVSEVRLSNTPGVNVSDLQWNPGVANMIAVAMTDGSAAVIEFKDGSFSINSIPQNSQASCLCWSPKGKQVVIGAKNGSLTQYKPELKAVKTFPPPQLGTSSLAVISVHWLSSFQFIAVYKNIADPSSKSNVVVVNVPKNAPTRYVNYEDLCFESDYSRPEHYFIHQQTWNILLIGTTNSMEASVLKMEGDNWVQWLQEEGSRPELPLTDDHKDVYNIGIALDTSSTRPIPIGEKLQIGPMPLLLMYAHNGILCLFHVINTLPDTPSICQPPMALQDTSGLHLFTIPEECRAPISVETKADKPPGTKGPDEGHPATQSQNSGLGQTNLSQPASSQANNAQIPQVSPAFSGFNIPSPQSSQQGLTSLGSNLAQSTQPSAVRPGFSQPPSFFSQNNLGQPSLGPANLSPSPLGQLTLIQPQPQLPKPNFGLSQPAQQASSPLQSLTQPQQIQPPAQQQLQTQPPLFQPQPTSPTKPAVTSVPWLPLNFQSQQQPSQPTSSSGPMLNQNQMSAPKATSAGHPTFPLSSIPEVSNDSESQETVPAVLSLTQAQESGYTEEPEEKDNSKEMEIIIEQCKELIVKFSREMEERQRVVKAIMSHTDQNIQQSSKKDKVILQIENLRKFEARLKECNSPDQAEINALGSSLMEMFGWYEKIKARERMTKNSSYIELMESQDLDPVTKNYLKSIDKHVYYLESQIKQAKVKLGALWDNLESSMDIPVMEAIYQSLVAQHNIIAAKKTLIESYENKLKKINQNRMHRSSRKRGGDLELSTLADRLLHTKLSENDILKDTSLKEVANNYIVLANKTGRINLTEKKITGLYEWHKNHKVIKTKVSKSSAIVQSSFWKDRTFNGEISPSKQSTPYSVVHGTPKKATVSVPRKSLFTLTTLDDESAFNGVSEAQKSEICFSSQAAQGRSDNAAMLNSKAGMSNVPNVADINLKNNLINNLAKASEGNKIDGIRNLSNPLPESLPKSSPGLELFNTSPLQSGGPKVNESIPTPAAFKSIPQTQQTVIKSKSEPVTVISTAWGSQAPVFGSSPLFSSISKSPTSSTSVFPSTGGSLAPQTTSSVPTTFNFSSAISNSPLGSSQTTSTASSNMQPPKSTFSPTPTTSLSIFSGSLKISATTPNSDANIVQPSTTSASPSMSSLFKGTSQAPSAVPFGHPGSAMNTINFGSLNLSSSATPASTAPSSVQPIGSTVSSAKPSSTLFTLSTTASSPFSFASLATSTASASSTNNASLASALQPTSTVSNAVSSSSGATIFGVTQPTIISSSSPNSVAATITTCSASTPSVSPKATLSQQIITNPATTSQSASPVQTSQPLSSSQNVSPKTTTVSWSSGQPLFGNVSSNPLTFSTTSPSIFGNSSSVTTASTIIFGSTTISAMPIFGGSAVTTSASALTTSTASSFMNVPSTTVSTATGTPTSDPSALVSSTSTPTTTSLTTSTSSTSIFAPTSTTTSTTASTSASPTSTSSVTSSASPSIFGSTTSATTTSSIFGGTSTTTSIFGASFNKSTTTAQPFFSNTPSFGAITTASSIFGGSTTTTSTSFGTSTTSPVFGGTPKTTTSIFGGTATTTTTTSFFGVTTASSPIFGGTPSFSTTTAATTASTFGTPNQSSSVFGAASALSSTSFFSPTTTSAQTFGNQSGASIFGGTTFGSPVTTTSSASFFGKPICSPTSTSSNVFGSTGNVFGQAPATTASSIFGGGANSFQQKSPFGQSANLFGQTTSSGGSFGSSGGSLFGGTASFSSPTNQQSNLFQQGNTSGSIFGGGSTGGPFSSPQTGQSTFGAPASFQSPQRPFGGSAPAFGSSPSFGSAPTFGGLPTFGGSPNKVFGSPTGAAPAFGSPNQQSSNTFETLAQQETLSFGNLAQQPQQQTFPPATSFAGSSFSSWR